MAKIDLKFIDCDDPTTIETFMHGKLIKIILRNKGCISEIINLDKSTAIKFAKTLRTEINKIKEDEDFERLSNSF
tara:strand:+ start:565 stop:789 length:225 start_codon:yes stop_codon:yes gene_type:complete